MPYQPSVERWRRRRRKETEVASTSVSRKMHVKLGPKSVDVDPPGPVELAVGRRARDAKPYEDGLQDALRRQTGQVCSGFRAALLPKSEGVCEQSPCSVRVAVLDRHRRREVRGSRCRAQTLGRDHVSCRRTRLLTPLVEPRQAVSKARVTSDPLRPPNNSHRDDEPPLLSPSPGSYSPSLSLA